ncbi:hypothetical protein [Nannocystis pusilla]|uniref:hypothetical protein n=1 Tax=Nannocystis pusilla TaxID=889268 RepID=UPI003DA4C2BB
MGAEAYDEGLQRMRDGANGDAERRFRAAAEAYVTAFEASTATADATRRSMYAGRIAKAYAAARAAFNNPDLRRSASEWCARWSSGPDAAASQDGFALLRAECANWPAPEPEPSEAPAQQGSPPVELDREEDSTHHSNDGSHIPDATKTGSGPKNPEMPQPDAVNKVRRRRLIGGCVALGLGGASLLVSLVGAVRQVQIEREIERDGCSKSECASRYGQGQRLENMTVATVVLGSVLAGTGVILTAVAFKRPNPRVSIAPALHPQFLGLGLRGSF